MRQILIFIGVLLLNIIACLSQEIAVTLVDSISLPKNKFQKFIGIDTHDNFYFSNLEIITKTQKSESWVYTNYQLGVPTSISILNPLQILVFYKEANSIVLLDRFLNEIQRIDLNLLNSPKVGWWVENTKNQEIWLYEGEKNQLEFFNYKTNIVLAKSIPFLEIPKQLAANFNNAYILFKNKINKYNIYGTLAKSIYIKEMSIEELKINRSYIIGNSKNNFQLYDPNLKNLGSFKISKNNNKDFSLSAEKLYIYNGSKIFIYKLTFPTN